MATKKRVHTFVAITNAILGCVNLSQVRKAQAEAAEMKARRAQLKADEEMIALRKQQVLHQTQGVIYRYQMTQANTENAVIRQSKQVEEIRLLELKIRKLEAELGIRTAADDFTPQNYG